MDDQTFQQYQKDVESEKSFKSLKNLFDFLEAHLLRQGAVAHDLKGHGDYKYHADDGKKCAVGAIIPGSIYHPDFEGSSFDEARREGPDYEDSSRFLFFNYLADTTIYKLVQTQETENKVFDLLGSFQNLHDGIPPRMWEVELATLRTRTFQIS